MNEEQLKAKLIKTGSDYYKLVSSHDEHYRTLDKIIKALKSYNLNIKIIQRYNYKLDDIIWSDAVLTAGGDGTFLLAAAKITNSNKPVFGVNTDLGINKENLFFYFKRMCKHKNLFFSANSEGHLLLPAQQSKNFENTLKKILDGQFK